MGWAQEFPAEPLLDADCAGGIQKKGDRDPRSPEVNRRISVGEASCLEKILDLILPNKSAIRNP